MITINNDHFKPNRAAISLTKKLAPSAYNSTA